MVTRAAVGHGIGATRRVRLAVTNLQILLRPVEYSAGRLLNKVEGAFTKGRGPILSHVPVPIPYPSGCETASLRRSFVTTAVATMFGIAAATIGTFGPQNGQGLGASQMVDRLTIFDSLRAPMLPSTSVDLLATPIAPRLPTRTSQPNSSTLPGTTTAEIQRVLNRYRDAFSTLDDQAVQIVWPSVDIRGLRSDFDRLYEHNLDFESCDIAVRGADAGAVCRGIAKSIPFRPRTTRRENRQWRFVLRRVNDRWLIDAVDVSSVDATAGRRSGGTSPGPD
jgi:hypothetical protein